jgi:hypothetical protein
VGLDEQLREAVETAVRFAEDGEELAGVVPAEPASGERVYLCVYSRGEERSWLALDAGGRPVGDRRLVRDAVSIAAMCELAEETAGGGDVGELRTRLVELRLMENPEGIEEAETAAAELQDVILAAPRLASVAYLDSIGGAALKLEQALGEVGGSPFAEAMKVGMTAAEELAADVERSYKAPLT